MLRLRCMSVGSALSGQKSLSQRTFPINVPERMFSRKRGEEYPILPSHAGGWKPVAPPSEEQREKIEREEELGFRRERDFIEVRKSTNNDFNLDFDLDLALQDHTRSLDNKMRDFMRSSSQAEFEDLESDEQFQRLVKNRVRELRNERYHEFMLDQKAKDLQRRGKMDEVERLQSEKHSLSIITTPERVLNNTLNEELRNQFKKMRKYQDKDKGAGLDEVVEDGTRVLVTKIGVRKGILSEEHDIIVDKLNIAEQEPDEEQQLGQKDNTQSDQSTHNTTISEDSAENSSDSTHTHIYPNHESIDWSQFQRKVQIEMDPVIGREYDLEEKKEYLNDITRDRSSYVWTHKRPGEEGYVDPFATYDETYGQQGDGDIKLAKEKDRLFHTSEKFSEQRSNMREKISRRQMARTAMESGQYTGDIRDLLHADDRGVEGEKGDIFYSRARSEKDAYGDFGLHIAEADGDDLYAGMHLDRLSRANQGQRQEDKIDEMDAFEQWDRKVFGQDSLNGGGQDWKKDFKEKLDRNAAAQEEPRMEGAIPQNTLFKSPLAYMPKFLLRSHPDQFVGETAMIVEDTKQQLYERVKGGRTETNKARAEKEEFESGQFRFPSNIRYYEMNMQFIKDHNSHTLSKWNSLLDFYKGLSSSHILDSADPYNSGGSGDVPTRGVFTFFVRARHGSKYAVPNDVEIVSNPWKDTKDIEQEANTMQDQQNPTTTTITPTTSNNITMTHTAAAELPHYRLVKVKFRPPKHIGEETKDFSGNKTISEMQASIDRTMVELQSSIDDEVSAQDLERWKRWIKLHREKKEWLKSKSRKTMLKELFSKDKGLTTGGIDEKQAFMDSPYAFMHLYPTASAQGEKIYMDEHHPKAHLGQAMLKWGAITFDSAVEDRVGAFHTLQGFIQHGYDLFQCRKWWSRRLTETELMERQGMAKYTSSDGVIFNGELEDEEKEVIWPDVNKGYGYRIHCAVRFLPRDVVQHPRLVSSTGRVHNAMRQSRSKTSAMQGLLFADISLEPEMQVEDEELYGKDESSVLPRGYGDVLVELRVPENIHLDEFVSYTEAAFHTLEAWESLLKQHFMEKETLKNLGLIDEEEDVDGQWIVKMMKSGRVQDDELMPYTKKLAQFYQKQMYVAAKEKNGEVVSLNEDIPEDIIAIDGQVDYQGYMEQQNGEDSVQAETVREVLVNNTNPIDDMDVIITNDDDPDYDEEVGSDSHENVPPSLTTPHGIIESALVDHTVLSKLRHNDSDNEQTASHNHEGEQSEDQNEVDFYGSYFDTEEGPEDDVARCNNAKNLVVDSDDEVSLVDHFNDSPVSVYDQKVIEAQANLSKLEIDKERIEKIIIALNSKKMLKQRTDVIQLYQRVKSSIAEAEREQEALQVMQEQSPTQQQPRLNFFEKEKIKSRLKAQQQQPVFTASAQTPFMDTLSQASSFDNYDLQLSPAYIRAIIGSPSYNPALSSLGPQKNHRLDAYGSRESFVQNFVKVKEHNDLRDNSFEAHVRKTLKRVAQQTEDNDVYKDMLKQKKSPSKSKPKKSNNLVDALNAML